ncbi:MAG TPA: tetratricopeptide repeat protein [Leptolyngbyaceae cyanobacterium]
MSQNFFYGLSATLMGAAIVVVQPQIAVPQTLDEQASTAKQADQLFEKGINQFNSGEFQAALATYQRVLEIRQTINDKVGVAATLDNIGEVYTSLSNYDKALENLQQAFDIRQQLNDQAGIGETLNNQSYVYRLLGDYPKALALPQQALRIAKQISNRAIEGESLHNIAAVYAAQGDYQKALELYEQALLIRQEVGNKRDEGRTLNNIGGVYYSLGEYEQALKYYQQSLAIRRTLNDKAGVGRLLSNIGLVYRQLGQYSKALEFYQESLVILKQIEDKASVASTVNGIGVIYESLGQYEQALEAYEQSLSIAKEIGNKPNIVNSIDNIGGIYYGLGRYPQALKSYQEALSIRQELNERSGVANSFNNIGGVYYNLGQYLQALEFLQQALAIRKEVGDKAGESLTLDAIGVVYEGLKQHSLALEYYKKGLAIAKQINDKSAEAKILYHIGGIYINLGDLVESENILKQALAIHKELGDRAGEAQTLNSIAALYYGLDKYSEAQELLQQSLAIWRQVGDRAGEAIALSNTAQVLVQQNQPELAIIFYKQSVNITESIRKNLKTLSLEQQKSFTNTVADNYRKLAELLLKQNRVWEAQKVLDLLKIQEVAEYLHNVRGNDLTGQGIDLLNKEEKIAEKYAEAVHLGQELADLRNIPEAERTPEQQQQIAELEKIQQQQRAEFNQFIRSPEIVTLVQDLNRTAVGQNPDLPNLNRLQRNLQQLKQQQEIAVVLYPLILEDRIELVLVTPDAAPVHIPVSVKREELNRVIVEFRQALQDPTSDARIPASKLYNWLVKPIEKVLSNTKAQTILYAPDGILRYIPLAALFDGEKWLTQRFRINNITAASLTDFSSKTTTQRRILAAAFTQGSYNVSVGNRQVTFAGLPYAGREVENLAVTVPTTTKLLDEAFNPATLIPRLNDYNIVHLATHAIFVTGTPEASFILFGNGDRITLRDVETWSLPNVDLVVLSACETGVGGQLGNGEEILGFGYQIQLAGALASISSLWSVSDGGTQALMDGFYTALQGGKLTKAEALRQAQIALITGQYGALGEQRGIAVQARTRNNLSSEVYQRLSHPYYWAPFVLIGNGFGRLGS